MPRRSEMLTELMRECGIDPDEEDVGEDEQYFPRRHVERVLQYVRTLKGRTADGRKAE